MKTNTFQSDKQLTYGLIMKKINAQLFTITVLSAFLFPTNVDKILHVKDCYFYEYLTCYALDKKPLPTVMERGLEKFINQIL